MQLVLVGVAHGAVHLVGQLGEAVSDLRPVGIVRIDGRRIDVSSEGGYITAGTAVEVTVVEGARIVVRPAARQGECGL